MVLNSVDDIKYEKITVFVGDECEVIDKDIIIYSYPERDKHPVLQVEIIEKMFIDWIKDGWKVAVFTNSPYILFAIEVNAAKNEIADKCKYYDTFRSLEDCTDNIEIIYKKMATPMQYLDNDRWKY